VRARKVLGMAALTLACVGCSSSAANQAGAGSATATVNYQDESGAQVEEVTVEGISCDISDGTGTYLTVNGDAPQSVVATVSGGETLALTITFGHDDLVFSSTAPFDTTDTGATFTDLPGGVMVSDGGNSTFVDEAATASGTITCP
jgi:ABC-type Fe3+-hydroxamate transport system substrate-binding protein